MIVVATSSDADEHSDLSWLLEYLSDFCIRVYDNVDAGSARYDGSRPFAITPNVAREGHAYLTFIVGVLMLEAPTSSG
jgi:hypothetical protein